MFLVARNFLINNLKIKIGLLNTIQRGGSEND